MKKLISVILLALHIQRGDFSDSSDFHLIEAPKPEVFEFNNTIYATCEVSPIPNLPAGQPKIFGQVLFRQVFPNGTAEVKINLRGFPDTDNQVRAIHIHQYGDLSQGCVTAGPHYNPQEVPHPNHPGDMGNFMPKQGLIRRFLKLPEVKLFGGQSVLGRAVVVHEKEDDLGTGADEESKRSGNAGRRIAGCVIGITKPHLWQKTEHVEEEESKR